LRSYLLVSLKRFLASEQHRASGVKRYETGPHIPLNELTESEVTDLELAETMSADRLYERRWALGVLEQVLGRLESEYQAAGNTALFDRLKEFQATFSPNTEVNLTTDYPDNIRLRTGLRRDRRIFWSAALLRRFLLPTNDAKYRNT